MLFWLFGCSAVVVLLALGMIVIGLVVWLIGRPLGWWEHVERPYGFQEWFDSLPREKQKEFKAWEAKKRAYVAARKKQRRACQRIMEEEFAAGRKINQWEAWARADDEVGVTARFGNVIGAKDEPEYHMGPIDDPYVREYNRRQQVARVARQAGVPPGWKD